MDPINYLGMTPSGTSPLDEYAKNYAAMANIQNTQIQNQQLQNEIKRKELYQSLVTDYQNNPSAANLQNIMVNFPEVAKNFEPMLNQMTQKQKDSDAVGLGQIINLLDNKDFTGAKSNLKTMITAADNSGQDSTIMKQAYDKIIENPQTEADILSNNSVLGTARTLQAVVLGTDKFNQLQQGMTEAKEQPFKVAEAKGKAQEATAKGQVAEATIPAEIAQKFLENQETQANINLTGARTQLTKAQTGQVGQQVKIAAERWGLDKQSLKLDILKKMNDLTNDYKQLPVSSQTLVNDKIVESATSKQQAKQLYDLSDKLSSVKVGSAPGTWQSGFRGEAVEKAKSILGTQDQISLLKNQYIMLRNSTALKNLPKGPASNADMQFAMGGLPSENADPKTLARFTKGMGMMMEVASKNEEVTADWVVHNRGSLGPATSDFTAGGYKVKAGQSLPRFQQSVGVAMVNGFNSKKQPQAKAPTAQDPLGIRH